MTELYLVRHFDDSQRIGLHRDDNGIDVEAEKLELMSEFIADGAVKSKASGITIVSSGLKRSFATAEELKRSLAKKVKTELNIVTDSRMSTLRHGTYRQRSVENIDHDERLAWQAFHEQSLLKRNILYRHGDPIATSDLSGSYTYPELARIFVSSGENQLEFSLRMFSFISDLIKNCFQERSKDLLVLSAHISPILRLHEMEALAKKAVQQIPLGELYVHEWLQMDNLKKDPQVMKFMNPAAYGVLNLGNLRSIAGRINMEVKFLDKLLNS